MKTEDEEQTLALEPTNSRLKDESTPNQSTTADLGLQIERKILQVTQEMFRLGDMPENVPQYAQARAEMVRDVEEIYRTTRRIMDAIDSFEDQYYGTFPRDPQIKASIDLLTEPFDLLDHGPSSPPLSQSSDQGYREQQLENDDGLNSNDPSLPGQLDLPSADTENWVTDSPDNWETNSSANWETNSPAKWETNPLANWETKSPDNWETKSVSAAGQTSPQLDDQESPRGPGRYWKVPLLLKEDEIDSWY